MKLVPIADIDMDAMLQQKQAHVRLDVRAITQARALGHDVNDFDAVNLFILSFEFRCVGYLARSLAITSYSCFRIFV